MEHNDDRGDGHDCRADGQQQSDARKIAEAVIADAHDQRIVVVPERCQKIERHADSRGNEQRLRRYARRAGERHGNRCEGDGGRYIVDKWGNDQC